MRRLRLLPIVMALAMVFCFSALLTFADSDDSDVTEIVYETNLPIVLYSEDIKDNDGTENLYFRNRSIHSLGGVTWKSPFCAGDKLIVKYSNNTTETYIDIDIDNVLADEDSTDSSPCDVFVLDGIKSNFDIGKCIYPDYDNDLQPGNNTVNLYCKDRTASVNVLVETPAMRAARLAEEARIRAQQEENARRQAEIARWNGVPDSSQPKLKAVKTKAGKKKVTVKWKKIDKKKLKHVGQIEIQYSLNPNFPMEQTTSDYTGKKKTSYKIKSLPSKKTYYVRVRVIKDIGDTRYVGPWTVTKVKIK
jgi:hypothetical protein